MSSSTYEKYEMWLKANYLLKFLIRTMLRLHAHYRKLVEEAYAVDEFRLQDLGRVAIT